MAKAREQSKLNTAEQLHESTSHGALFWIAWILGILAAAAAIIGAVPLVMGWVNPAVPEYVLIEEDLDDPALAREILASIRFPLDWTMSSPEASSDLSAGDDHMTVSVRVATDLPEGAATDDADVSSMTFSGPEQIIAAVPAVRGEYDAAGRHFVQLRVHSGGVLIAAECRVEDRAWGAYKRACAKILDTFTIYPSMAQYIPHLWFADLNESNIWRDSPDFLGGTWDYVTANWDDYDPRLQHPVEGEALEAALSTAMTSRGLFEGAQTTGGRPIAFAGDVDVLQPLEVLDGGRTTWVMQIVSAEVPDWRAYVQFNGPSDLSAADGDLAIVLNAVAIAGGTVDLTDGGIDNCIYLLAQEVLVF